MDTKRPHDEEDGSHEGSVTLSVYEISSVRVGPPSYCGFYRFLIDCLPTRDPRGLGDAPWRRCGSEPTALQMLGCRGAGSGSAACAHQASLSPGVHMLSVVG